MQDRAILQLPKDFAAQQELLANNIIENNYEAVVQLVELGVDIKSEKSQNHILTAINNKNSDIALYLIESEAKLDQQQNTNYLINIAIELGLPEVASLLIVYGLDPSSVTADKLYGLLNYAMENQDDCTVNNILIHALDKIQSQEKNKERLLNIIANIIEQNIIEHRYLDADFLLNRYFEIAGPIDYSKNQELSIILDTSMEQIAGLCSTYKDPRITEDERNRLWEDLIDVKVLTDQMVTNKVRSINRDDTIREGFEYIISFIINDDNSQNALLTLLWYIKAGLNINIQKEDIDVYIETAIVIENYQAAELLLNRLRTGTTEPSHKQKELLATGILEVNPNKVILLLNHMQQYEYKIDFLYPINSNKDELVGVVSLAVITAMGTEDKKLQIIKKLIESNIVDINQKSKCGLTALDNALRNGYENIAKYLIKNGADVCKPTNKFNERNLYNKLKKEVAEEAQKARQIAQQKEAIGVITSFIGCLGVRVQNTKLNGRLCHITFEDDKTATKIYLCMIIGLLNINKKDISIDDKTLNFDLMQIADKIRKFKTPKKENDISPIEYLAKESEDIVTKLQTVCSQLTKISIFANGEICAKENGKYIFKLDLDNIDQLLSNKFIPILQQHFVGFPFEIKKLKKGKSALYIQVPQEKLSAVTDEIITKINNAIDKITKDFSDDESKHNINDNTLPPYPIAVAPSRIERMEEHRKKKQQHSEIKSKNHKKEQREKIKEPIVAEKHKIIEAQEEGTTNIITKGKEEEPDVKLQTDFFAPPKQPQTVEKPKSLEPDDRDPKDAIYTLHAGCEKKKKTRSKRKAKASHNDLRLESLIIGGTDSEDLKDAPEILARALKFIIIKSLEEILQPYAEQRARKEFSKQSTLLKLCYLRNNLVHHSTKFKLGQLQDIGQKIYARNKELHKITDNMSMTTLFATKTLS